MAIGRCFDLNIASPFQPLRLAAVQQHHRVLRARMTAPGQPIALFSTRPMGTTRFGTRVGQANDTPRGGLITAQRFDAGVRDLYRTTEADGVFCYTFFKGAGEKR
jgi:hypothetical protein